MADYPRPIQVLVCNTCGQPWDAHIAVAERNRPFELEVTAEDLDFKICIELLKNANKGPPGPMGIPGPTGSMGMTGEKGDKGDQGTVHMMKIPFEEKND